MLEDLTDAEQARQDGLDLKCLQVSVQCMSSRNDHIRPAWMSLSMKVATLQCKG